MYCCSAQESKMDYKRRFLLGGSKQKVQQHQQYQMPELGRTLSAPLASTAPASPLVSSAAAGSCNHPVSHTTPIADIQQGISKYLDALNVFCHISVFTVGKCKHHQFKYIQVQPAVPKCVKQHTACREICRTTLLYGCGVFTIRNTTTYFTFLYFAMQKHSIPLL